MLVIYFLISVPFWGLLTHCSSCPEAFRQEQQADSAGVPDHTHSRTALGPSTLSPWGFPKPVDGNIRNLKRPWFSNMEGTKLEPWSFCL